MNDDKLSVMVVEFVVGDLIMLRLGCGVGVCGKKATRKKEEMGGGVLIARSQIKHYRQNNQHNYSISNSSVILSMKILRHHTICLFFKSHYNTICNSFNIY